MTKINKNTTKIKATTANKASQITAPQNSIEIYRDINNKTEIKVHFDSETFWLSQNQIAELFARDRSVISKHIKKIFDEDELEESSNVQKMHFANSDKPTTLYSLDLIISVGYRVNSKQGTQFRIWATERLKNYLVQGFAINEKRVLEYQKNLAELQQTIKLIQHSVDSKELSSLESKGFLDIITNYTSSFILLNQFDSGSLHLAKLDQNITYEISYKEACEAIDELKKQLISKKEATALFGNQKDCSFAGILGNIIQSFAGEYLYKTIEEQASHLLYFTIKNHPFSDGNKRIGAFLFIWFLAKNQHSLKKSGELKINDNGLVALALLVAQSNPQEKELMIKLIINLINEQ
jgi:death-on-curing family protein